MKRSEELFRNLVMLLVITTVLYWAFQGAVLVGKFSGYLYERHLRAQTIERSR